MKKTLIALSLAVLPAAAMAEVVLYGQIKAGYEFASVKDSHAKRGPWVNGVTDYGSRIGFKGQEDLGNGLKAIWQVEQAVGLDGRARGFGTRDSFIGLEGGFGKVRAGYLANYLDSDMSQVDAWEYGNEALGLGRFTRTNTRAISLRYDSPDFAGFNFALQYTPRDNRDQNTTLGTHTDVREGGGFDIYGLGLGYQNSGVFVKYGFRLLKHQMRPLGSKDKYDGQVHRLEGGYDANNIFAALGLQHTRNYGTHATGARALAGDNAYAAHLAANPGDTAGAERIRGITLTNANRVRTTEVALTGGYRFGNVFPKLSYAHGWDAKSTWPGVGTLKNTKYDQVVLGADYSFSKRTSANAQVGWLREGLGEYAGRNLGKRTTTAFGAGLKHVF